jgi:hypothetical protein
LANLRPRSPVYGEAKSKRQPLVTDKGWDGFKALAASHGLSASELIERIGRGTVTLGGDGPQGDVLKVMSWGNVHCKAKDAVGNIYACKRISTP